MAATDLPIEVARICSSPDSLSSEFQRAYSNAVVLRSIQRNPPSPPSFVRLERTSATDPRVRLLMTTTRLRSFCVLSYSQNRIPVAAQLALLSLLSVAPAATGTPTVHSLSRPLPLEQPLPPPRPALPPAQLLRSSPLLLWLSRLPPPAELRTTRPQERPQSHAPQLRSPPRCCSRVKGISAQQRPPPSPPLGSTRIFPQLQPSSHPPPTRTSPRFWRVPQPLLPWPSARLAHISQRRRPQRTLEPRP